MKIAVLGLWHQGIVGAACLAEMGHDVTAADPNAETIARLSRRPPHRLFEPGLDDLLAEGIASTGRLTFTTSYARMRCAKDAPFVVFVIMFDTPVNERDESDLDGIFACVEAVAPVLAARDDAARHRAAFRWVRATGSPRIVARRGSPAAPLRSPTCPKTSGWAKRSSDSTLRRCR